MNVISYSFESVRTVFEDMSCAQKSSKENHSLRVSGNVNSMNRSFLVEGSAEDENLNNGPKMKRWVGKATLMMRDHVPGHGTTLSVFGSLDHSRAAR